MQFKTEWVVNLVCTVLFLACISVGIEILKWASQFVVYIVHPLMLLFLTLSGIIYAFFRSLGRRRPK